jgi:hypothetical protein
VGRTDTVQIDPGRVEMRFQDVQIQPVAAQTQPAVGSRGMTAGKAKVPKKGRSGEQEIGVV